MSTPSMSYRTVRWVAKEVSETWFREHGAIETDNIPEEGGVLFAAWHPGFSYRPIVNDFYIMVKSLSLRNILCSKSLYWVKL